MMILHGKRDLMKTKRSHLISFGVEALRVKAWFRNALKSDRKGFGKRKRSALNWKGVLEKATKKVNKLHPFFRTVNINLKVNSYRSLVYLSKSKEDKRLNHFSQEQKEKRRQISYKRFLIILKADLLLKELQEKNKLLISKGLEKEPMDWLVIFRKSNMLVEREYPYLQKIEIFFSYSMLKSLRSQVYAHRKKCEELKSRNKNYYWG